MRYLLYGLLGLLILNVILSSMGYDASYYIVNPFEWITCYVLPWIALYWFVQFVKTNRE